MNCREFTEFLNEYFDGSLPDDERDLFDEHIGECPDCRTYLQNYRHTVRLCHEAFGANEPVPSDAPEDLVTAILAAQATNRTL